MRNVLLRRLVAVFGSPPHDDPKQYLAEVDRITGSMSEAVLNKAADNLVLSWQPTYREPWPLPATISKAVADASAAISGCQRPTDETTYGKAEYARVYATLRDPTNKLMVTKAGEQKWILGLFSFVKKQKRMPTWDECDDIVKHSQFRYACLDGQQEMGALASALLNLATSMEARQNQLIDDVIHRVR